MLRVVRTRTAVIRGSPITRAVIGIATNARTQRQSNGSPSASFTQTAERLGLRQSTVSQHIRKLEEVGRRLFSRDTHSVTATADGEAIFEFARGILAANERAQRLFCWLSTARAAPLRHIRGFRGV